jgi:hypothetical protein
MATDQAGSEPVSTLHYSSAAYAALHYKHQHELQHTLKPVCHERLPDTSNVAARPTCVSPVTLSRKGLLVISCCCHHPHNCNISYSIT